MLCLHVHCLSQHDAIVGLGVSGYHFNIGFVIWCAIKSKILVEKFLIYIYIYIYIATEAGNLTKL
jgi:hypothetical protein